MCDFLELPERSPTSTASLFMNSSKLTICSLNIQSLNANMEDLKADHLINSCDILFLSETWLETSYPDTLFHPKSVKTRHLKDGKGRGLSVFSTKTNCAIEIHDSMIKIRLHDEGFSVIAVYHACPFCVSRRTLENALLPRLQLSRAISSPLTQHALNAS